MKSLFSPLIDSKVEINDSWTKFDKPMYGYQLWTLRVNVKGSFQVASLPVGEHPETFFNKVSKNEQ